MDDATKRAAQEIGRELGGTIRGIAREVAREEIKRMGADRAPRHEPIKGCGCDPCKTGQPGAAPTPDPLRPATDEEIEAAARAVSVSGVDPGLWDRDETHRFKAKVLASRYVNAFLASRRGER